MDQKEFSDFKKELEDAGVTLVAVSKTKSISEILRVYGYGQRDFGENYVQELIGKHSQLPRDIRWHFIGHLQRNKVKDIVGYVHLIHGIDSERLLKEVSKQAVNKNLSANVLLQVHIAEEATKFGFDENEIKDLVRRIHLFPNVTVKGLMGMATLTDNKAKVDAEFSKLNALFTECKKEDMAKDWNVLSMGMSGDYVTAIKNGSTMVRIGTLIFGARN